MIVMIMMSNMTLYLQVLLISIEKYIQSTQTYPHFEDWIVFFLFESIRKAWNHLEDENGYLAIHIINIGNQKPYADLIHLFIQAQFYNALFMKTILTSGGKNVIPIWVWKKTNQLLPNRSRMQSTAYNILRSHYPNISKKLLH